MGHEFHWTCHRTGDCCLEARSITITPEEKVALEGATSVPIDTVPHEDPRFLSWLMPNGCPMLARELDGTATCTVHAMRPYQCRRFMCLREDGEPYRAGGPLGCRNLTERLQGNRHAVAFYASSQRRAQGWAKAHGWTR